MCIHHENNMTLSPLFARFRSRFLYDFGSVMPLFTTRFDELLIGDQAFIAGDFLAR